LQAENERLRAALADSLEIRVDIRGDLLIANQQLEAERADRQQLQAQLDRTLAELAELQENPPPTGQNPAPAIDLPEQLGEIVNFLKQLLPPDTKWPKRVIPELRKFLESKED
jgi:outer membrane protein TolC